MNATNNSLQDYLKTPNGSIKVVVLEGSAYERGLIHGKTLKKEINEVVAIWKNHLEANYKLKADAFIEQFFKKTDFLPAIKKWTPNLFKEVLGISDGAGIDFNTMLLFQLPDEQWVNAEEDMTNRCSSIGVNMRNSRPAMVAQNFDIPGFYNGYQVLLYIKYPKSDLEALVFTFAGMIGANGMNNKAVGVVVNALSQLAHSNNGLPVAFVVRGLLEQNNQKAAIDFLNQVKHATGQNYIIGGKEKVYDFECSANKVSRFIPCNNAQVVYHTNHPLFNDDYCEAFRQGLGTNDTSKIAKENSSTRFQSLEKRLKEDDGSINVDAFKSILKSQDSEQFPVCRIYRNENSGFTFGSTIMIFSEKLELWLAAGPPDSTDYVMYSFSTNSSVE